MRDLVQRGLHLAVLPFPTVALMASINPLDSDKANRSLFSSYGGPSLFGIDATFIFQLVFWASLVAIILAESILVTVTLKHIKSQASDRNGLGAGSIVELLWTMIPPLFTIVLAVASMDHLRLPASLDLAEATLLGCGVLLLVVSIGILLARSLKALSRETPGKMPLPVNSPEQTISSRQVEDLRLNYEQPDEAVLPWKDSARTASLSIESEALPRGNL